MQTSNVMAFKKKRELILAVRNIVGTLREIAV